MFTFFRTKSRQLQVGELPSWAKPAPDNPKRVYVMADQMYEEWLKLLEAPHIDQYWLECAHLCGVLDVLNAYGGPNANLDIIIKASPEGKRKYRQAGKPEGKGVALANRGRHARKHWQRIRGLKPTFELHP